MAGSVTLKTFKFAYPFTGVDGQEYEKIEVRRPRVRDLKTFVKDAEKDAVGAIERSIANLSDTPPTIISDIDLEDFAPIKAWFTAFLKLMSDESEG